MPCCDAFCRSSFVWSIRLAAEGTLVEVADGEVGSGADFAIVLANSSLDFADLIGPGLRSILCFLAVGVGSGVEDSVLLVEDETGVVRKREDEARQAILAHCG